MAITTALKKAFLEDAWDAASAITPVDLRKALRAYETEARKAIAGGSFTSVAANRRTSEFAPYGPGQITPTEVVELWRELIGRYDSAKDYLTQCALYGLDPSDTEANGFPIDAGTPVPTPAAVSEDTIHTWMVDHLIAVTEIRSDYRDLYTAAGMQTV